MRIYLVLLIQCVFIGFSFCQRLEIEGSVSDSITKNPIVYANVLNYTNGTGTITNSEGYFKLNSVSPGDSIIISFIGYNSIGFLADDKGHELKLFMTEVSMLMDAVEIVPEDDPYLYKLIGYCRKNRQSLKKSAKAYYELKSFYDNTQVELVEAYYNLDIDAYNVESLTMKAGRLAMRRFEDRFFGSLEVSRALTMMEIMKRSPYFPDGPLDLKRRKLRNKYYLYLDTKYKNQAGDSIYVIEYQPRDDSGEYYSGKLWINQSDYTILKQNARCESCQDHPFLPLFPDDRINSVMMEYTKTYRQQNGEVFFNHIDFNYSVDYSSRMRKDHALDFNISSEVLLYAYDFEDRFFIPQFGTSALAYDDFRMINAIPYNLFFWNNNNEYRTNHKKNINESFFRDPQTLNSFEVFDKNTFFEGQLFQHPFTNWSSKRSFFKEMIPDTSSNRKLLFGQDPDYNLAIKLFVDINEYNGKINILSSTIIDPFESYCYLPIDETTHCFVNICFDLCEIMRRELEQKLSEVNPDMESINQAYVAFLSEFDQRKQHYLDEVDKGNNYEALLKWNNFVKQKLDIDNFSLFGMYPQEERE